MGNSPTGPADIANRAIVLMGGFDSNVPLTGIPPTFDGTPLGLAAGVAYGGVVQTVGKMFGWDFARNYAPLAETDNAAPVGLYWNYEYIYPTNGIEIRQVFPQTFDVNNPIPVRWEVGNTLVNSITTKVIWCNIQNAIGIISSQPQESLWDAGFVEQVIRLLASELSMGAAGRPETGQLEFERAGQTAGIFQQREG